MIKILVIEDELIIRKGIIVALQQTEIEHIVVGQCGSIQEALVLAPACQPDLVLLDVNLQDGNAFDFLEQTTYRSFKVIFITAYSEYAIQAIKTGALDYLLKPIDEDELREAILKVNQRQQSQAQINISQNHLNGRKEQIVLRQLDSIQIIQIKDLLFCKSDGGYTSFHLNDDRKFTASKPIKEYENLLASEAFFRCHQSYIVNLRFIDRYERAGLAILKNKQSIPVSTRKKEQLLQLLAAL